MISHELQTHVGDRAVNVTLAADGTPGLLTYKEKDAILALVSVLIERWNQIAEAERVEA